jgi:hypothetical protein
MEQLLPTSHFELRKFTAIAIGIHDPGAHKSLTLMWLVNSDFLQLTKK